jgi:hypothetical protein
MQRDPDKLRARLRIDTCRLLRYDIDKLTSAQEVRLNRATMLRLTLDDIETRLLNNNQHEFDTKAYVAASESLERLVGGDPERDQGHDFSADAAALDALLGRRHEALEQRRDSEAKNSAIPAGPPSQRVAPTVSSETVESPVAELMPANSVPPKRPRVEYIDHAVLATPKPRSPVTESFFQNVPGSVNPFKRWENNS